MRLTFSPISFALFIVGSIIIYISRNFVLDILGGVLFFGGLLAPVIEMALKERKAAAEETIPPTLEEAEAKPPEVVRRETSVEEVVSPTLISYEPKVVLEFVQAFVQVMNLHFSSKMSARDLISLKRPLEIFQVEEREIAMASADPEERRVAKWTLLEMSKREDPIVRRRCIQALGALEEPDEETMARLKEIAQTDPVRGVRLEAQKAIEKLSKPRPEMAEAEGG